MHSPLHRQFRTPPTHSRVKQRNSNSSFVGQAYKSPQKSLPFRELNEDLLGNSFFNLPSTPEDKQPAIVIPNADQSWVNTSLMSATNLHTPVKLHATVSEFQTPTPFKQYGAITEQYQNHVGRTIQPEQFAQSHLSAMSDIPDQFRNSRISSMRRTQTEVFSFLHFSFARIQNEDPSRQPK